jgi:molybdopterin-containing oxidoreductase family iron-sulfur binding subunit
MSHDPMNETESNDANAVSSTRRSPNDRRSFLRAGMGTMAAVAATAGLLEPLRTLKDQPSLEEFLQTHYSMLTPEMMDNILKRIEQETARDYGTEVQVRDYRPMEGVEFAYALNITRCVGSRRCVYACMKENNISPDHPEMSYIRVLELDNGSLDLEEGDPAYDRDQVRAEGKYYLPISCQQCRKSPCTKACPVQATWTEPDGIRVIDYSWCIGCRYCIAACPYEARRFNWTRPVLAPEEINPQMGYLSNRIRPRGVTEKCHFCLHRVRQGKNPACLEVCPSGARVFGNLRDPNDPIHYILKEKRVYILKAELGTLPRFYYFFDV